MHQNPMQQFDWFNQQFRTHAPNTCLSHITGGQIPGEGTYFVLHAKTSEDAQEIRLKLQQWLHQNKFDFKLEVEELTKDELAEFHRKVSANQNAQKI
ncbi:MAG: hypothetical protein ACR2OW_07115 [Methyloligellaceae bacterium]